jgi:hypothetical protein
MNKAYWWLILAIAVLVGWMVMESNREKDEALTEGKAYHAATNFVSMRLKAPATAKFATMRECRIEPVELGYNVRGHVDAQNSFGAMLRTDWEVTVERTGYVDGKLIE